MGTPNALAVRKQKMEHLKAALSVDSVKHQFDNALKENSGSFVASIIDLVGSDNKLQECEPTAVIMECMKAATLKLPINKQLGFAYVVPYKKVPQFQIGYKGYIQLAMRTGQYRYINADCLYEGMEIERDQLTGAIKITGEPKKNAKVIGYFCHMEMLNGFTKTLDMTKEQAEAWGKKYSPSFKFKSSAWQTNFDEMALKTTVRRLISKWGIMSIEMEHALTTDVEAQTAAEIKANANGEIIDITPKTETKPKKEQTKKELPKNVDTETGEVKDEKREVDSDGAPIPTEEELEASKAKPGF